MCWSSAARASGGGEWQLLHPSKWNYGPVADRQELEASDSFNTTNAIRVQPPSQSSFWYP